MTNTLSWFEIPVADMDRAVDFYEEVLNIKVEIHDFGGLIMGWFPPSENPEAATGSLVLHETYIPSQEGPLIYFNSTDVDIEINKVEPAGGKVLRLKTKITDEIGYMALFLDTEGNRIALHSRH